MIKVVYAMTHHVYYMILPSLYSLKAANPDAQVFILCEDDELPFRLPMPATIINVSGQKYFPPDSVNYNNAFKYINLLKVCYPDILPREVDKVIHLDIDTIIWDSLQPLYDIDLDGKWFAACPEYHGTYKPFGDTYYNMGVAVINLEQMRKDYIWPPMMVFLNAYQQPWADQDAWNYYGISCGKVVPFDLRYNESPINGMTDDPAIIHYCGISDWWTNRKMARVECLDLFKQIASI